MENYAYGASYPDSGESSPRSREIDFENTSPWEDQPNSNYKVKFMCSYGGKVHPRPNDNQLSYIGGETKILAADRNIKFAGLIGKLSALCDADVSFKYQLPGEDLDALISVTNDDDLEHMMHEYDRMYRASSKPARLRLFLFPANTSTAATITPPGDGKSDKEKFVDALNSGPIQSSSPPSTVEPPTSNVDFLFGLDKGMPPPPPPLPVVAKLPDPSPEPAVAASTPDDRIGSGLIQDLQRLHIGGQEQGMFRRRSDDNTAGDFSGGDYYVQKFPEKVIPANLPVTAPPGYWTEKHVTSGGIYPGTSPGPEQPVYMFQQAPASAYHAPMGRPMTGPAGYYAVQRMAPEVYRDYNVGPPTTAISPPSLPPQPPQKIVTGYSEGIPMVRPTVDAGGYAAMAYDSGAGRHVYYAAPGGVMQPPPPYQAMASAAVGTDMRGVGVLNQEGKVVGKASQASV